MPKPPDAQWAQEVQFKYIEELKQTAHNGRSFPDSVTAVLERERSRVKRENEQCTPVDKEPWSEEIVVDVGDCEDESDGKATRKVEF